ncbi:MAG: hypothetical protein MK200_05750, partial [Nitrosopumilus sp.]|nr:hypothetical protein [Nitrosopumilus sp.]
MKRFLEFGTPERTAFIKKVTPGEMPSGKFQEADHIKNMDVEIEEGSLDWEKDFKGYSKPNELKAIRGIIARNKDGIGGVIKMMKDDPKEFKKIVQKLKEEVELDEVYGTVKISGKSGRLVQHSPGEVVFVGNKKQTEKNLKQLKKDGGDGYIMQGVTIKVGEKVKGVGEENKIEGFSQFLEAKDSTVVFSFGRFNP